jgi:hypothetical protein
LKVRGVSSQFNTNLAAVIGLLAIGYGVPASASALQNVFISKSDDDAFIEIRFNCLHRFDSLSSPGPASDFEINLTRFADCDAISSRDGGQSSTRPTGRGIVALDEVDYLALDGGDATVRLRFVQPVEIDIVQTGDLRGLKVRLAAITGTPGEVRPPEKRATETVLPPARTAERLARADAAALERAARRDAAASVPADYAVNLQTSVTEAEFAGLSDVALDSEQLYVMKSERGADPVFRLRLGFFATEAQAEVALSRLQARYPAAWVVKIGAADREQAASGSPARGMAPLAPALAVAVASAGTVATRSAEELGALMADARAAVLAGDFARAAALYTAVITEPQNSFSRDARELLGVARQRNGEVPGAIAEYRRYLEDYPDGEGSERVRQRLVALTTARDAPKTSLRTASRGENADSWDAFGSFSQYYRHDAADLAGKGMTTKASVVQSDASYDLRKRGDRFDFASRARLGYDYDVLNEAGSLGNRTRIYDLYADLFARDLGLGARVGRQTERSGGVLGRYDGAHVSYQLRPDIKLNVMGGFPVYLSSDSVDTSRVFYATSVDVNNVLELFDTSVFFNTQSIDGIEDRQAAGVEMRYFDGSRSVVGLVDYDIGFGTLNTLSLIGNWYFDSGLALSASADYHRSPFPVAENALIGQAAGTIDELLQSFTEDQVRQLAEDRSGEVLNYSLGVSRPLAERWQINADVTFTQLAEGPGSGGVLALPDSGREYYVYTSLVGSSLFKEGDVSILGLRYSDSDFAQVATLYLDSRYPVTSRLRLNPRLAVSLREITADNSSETLLSPSLRLLYRFARRYQIELEGGGDLGSRSGALNTDTTAYFVYVGYRTEF